MRKPEGVVVYKVQLRKESLVTDQVVLASSFALLADDLAGWEKENYTVMQVQRLGEPIVLDPIKVIHSGLN